MIDKRNIPLMLDKNNKVHENGEIIDIFDYVDRLKEKEYILDRMVEFANLGLSNLGSELFDKINAGEMTQRFTDDTQKFGMIYESFLDLYNSLSIEIECKE